LRDRGWIAPVEQPTKFDLVTNVTTAKALGVVTAPCCSALTKEFR
jgi:hypothetical protein